MTQPIDPNQPYGRRDDLPTEPAKKPMWPWLLVAVGVALVVLNLLKADWDDDMARSLGTLVPGVVLIIAGFVLGNRQR